MNERKEILSYVPYVIEQTHKGERSYDIFSRLLKDRIIFIGSEINDYVANIIIAQLLFLQTQDADKDISVYINSPGGSISAGLAIYDTIQYILPDVATYCVGMAASMGALLLACGKKDKRFVLPHSRIMIHQPLGGVSGQASDIEIHAREIIKTKAEILEILSLHTGQSLETLRKDCDRDYFMTGEEAVNYGLADKVIRKSFEENKKNDKKDE